MPDENVGKRSIIDDSSDELGGTAVRKKLCRGLGSKIQMSVFCGMADTDKRWEREKS